MQVQIKHANIVVSFVINFKIDLSILNSVCVNVASKDFIRHRHT